MTMTVCDICRKETAPNRRCRIAAIDAAGETVERDLCDECWKSFSALFDQARRDGHFATPPSDEPGAGCDPDHCPDAHDGEGTLPPAEDLFTDEEREIARTVLGVEL